MSKQHVHVRLHKGMVVSPEGELVEEFRCRCGAAWTKTYQVEDRDAD
ncbi:hypothetical protein [Streptomyces agglomeratus]|nr:hypothetical protein [Streptomyces agglomeratus]